jgi:putative cell wall-binding protein
MTELARLQPLRIKVLGGSAAVGDAVVTQLHAYTSGSVIRFAGPDRYSTAATVVERAFAGRTGPVFVASGGGFPDALSGGAVAAATGAPIVLAKASEVPDPSMTAIAALTPTSFVLLGGPGVLGPGVADDLHARYPGVPIHRWSGPDRFATSAVISAAAFPAGATTVYLATGLRYPDALAGVPAAGLAGAPLLLARLDCLPQVVAVELRRLHPAKVVLLGGPGALASSAVTTVCGTVP